MTRRNPLPPELTGRGFAVSEARAAGVSARRLDAQDLDAPVRGTRVPHGGGRLDAVAALLSAGQAFTGPTAANIWGMPLPRRWQDERRLWVSTRSADCRMRRPDVVASRRSAGDSVLIDGYPVLDAASMWCSLATILELHDVIAVADRIVTTSPSAPALATPERLAAAAHTHRRGSRSLHAALREMREGSWSRPESLLRLAVVRAGLPEPRLNENVPVGRGRVAAPDLAWPDFRVCAEYDGHWHDSRGERARDLERHELLADAGWLVTHIRAGDLFPTPMAAVARVLCRLTSRGYRHVGTIQWAGSTSWLP